MTTDHVTLVWDRDSSFANVGTRLLRKQLPIFVTVIKRQLVTDGGRRQPRFDIPVLAWFHLERDFEQ